MFRYCYLHPSGVDRSEVEDFVRRLCLPAVPHSVTHVAPGRELFHFLHSLTVSPVNDGEVADRLAEFGLYVDDPVAFVDECERLRAIRREGGQSLNAVPLIPLGPWLEFCAHMERIGNAVVETIGENAEELRNRLTRCSFAHCNLADAVTACIMYLRGLVGDEIVRRGLAEVPETADFSWGALLVC